MRITIVGCGFIGSKLAEATDEMAEVKRMYLMDRDTSVAKDLTSRLKKAIVIDDVEEELYHSDLVVEAASQDAAYHMIPKIVSRGVDVMIMSVGALVNDSFRKSILLKAKESGARLFIPSGAVCGTDGLRSSAIGRLDEVELITTKGTKSFADIEYISEHGIDIKNIKKQTVIFSGSARNAVVYFPKNVNVAATVSLLGIGFDKTKVKIVLDPFSHSNSHELRIKGEFGQMVCHTYNVPSPDNPKTSYLAAMSAISALKRIVRNEWVGI